jgi:hypothetical protein
LINKINQGKQINKTTKEIQFKEISDKYIETKNYNKELYDQFNNIKSIILMCQTIILDQHSYIENYSKHYEKLIERVNKNKREPIYDDKIDEMLCKFF